MRHLVLVLVLVLTVLTATVHAAESPIQGIRDARTDREAARLVKVVERDLLHGDLLWTHLQFTADALTGRGMHDEAAALLARWRGKQQNDRLEFHLELNLAQALRQAERYDEALQAAERAQVLGAAAETPVERDSAASDVHGAKARILEEAGRLEEALEHYRAWEWAATCGVGSQSFAARREVAIGRVLMGLGRTDEALAKLSAASTQGLDGGFTHGAGEAALLFGRYSQRAGLADAALRRGERLEGESVALWRALVRAGVDLERGHLAGVLDALDCGRSGKSLPEAGAHARSLVPQLLATALSESTDGESRRSELAEAVVEALVDGNRTLVLLATEFDLPGAEGGLRARAKVEIDQDWRSWIQSVLDG